MCTFFKKKTIFNSCVDYIALKAPLYFAFIGIFGPVMRALCWFVTSYTGFNSNFWFLLVNVTGFLHHFHFTFRGLYCEDILWILIFTRQHVLTCFHGTNKKFYFCLRCSHTLCPLTRTNIEDHHALYLTS